ncbi:uncharacterized protein LOC112051117 [Bicyclus anynana]|uniref:Uncharacterized protein LOC112051117 n=1 Tax=Bicyclus anynana TaxID=110368 RepID=A0ABM3LJP3_BICAN|nr:uncharacterized protein LOC112051117 [Bicyclus anynana]XP_052739273.1 uncharacterized protein LOC112051117 [Bicyclus anynana]XP_052739274.1 uncharacterized protein LOC112051117 [Bicyclus anynana]
MAGDGEDLFGLYPEIDSDDEEENPADTLESAVESDEFGSKSNQIEFSKGSVSCLNECYTAEAQRLCILDVVKKLNNSDHYDIGGTYCIHNSNIQSELWFYCTTSILPHGNCLLNIFFCDRQGRSVSIGISDANTITKKTIYCNDTVSTQVRLSSTLCWKTFKSNEREESHLLKTYCFSKENVRSLDKQILCIPIEIKINEASVVDRGTMLRIKKNHDLSDLFKRGEYTDYTLESSSGMKYEVHKLLLATHSSVLRNMLKNSNADSLRLNIDDKGMEQFLEYIYTGSVKDILDHNWSQLIELADQFKLDKLFKEAENAITEQICVKNAIDVAVLSEKYKLVGIQRKVFEFIKAHPEVLETDGWKHLADIDLTKKLFQQVHSVLSN